MAQAECLQEKRFSCDVGVYSNSNEGVDAFAADVQSVCDLFRAASRRSNSTFAGELNTKNASAMADLVSLRMEKLLSQHHGLAVPDQAPTPGKKLKKGSSAESSPGTSSEPGSSNEKNINIIEDLARYSTHLRRYNSRQLHCCPWCTSWSGWHSLQLAQISTEFVQPAKFAQIPQAVLHDTACNFALISKAVVQ